MIFSIGYQGLTLEKLMRKLDEHNITLLVDVRSRPQSRRREFNRAYLEKVLGDRYVWKGNYLGGLGGTKQVGYDACVAWLAKKSMAENVCVMCMEANPKDCHRDFWISNDLKADFGVDVVHILHEHSVNMKLGRC